MGGSILIPSGVACLCYDKCVSITLYSCKPAGAFRFSLMGGIFKSILSCVYLTNRTDPRIIRGIFINVS